MNSTFISAFISTFISTFTYIIIFDLISLYGRDIIELW